MSASEPIEIIELDDEEVKVQSKPQNSIIEAMMKAKPKSVQINEQNDKKPISSKTPEISEPVPINDSSNSHNSQVDLTPSSSTINTTNSSSSFPANPTKPKLPTAKQLAKEEEKKAREAKKEQERLDKERAKEEEKRQKEEKRLAKEEEKRKKDEERERIKKEAEAKKEQLRKEKEEREAKKLKEKLKREAERELKRKEEESKKLQELEKQKQQEAKKAKSMISNFFKVKQPPPAAATTTTKPTTTAVLQTEKNNEENITKYSKLNKFYIKDRTIITNNIYTPLFLQSKISEYDKSSTTESLAQFFQNNKPKYPQTNPIPALDIYESTSSQVQTLKLKYLRFYESIQTYNATFTKPIQSDSLSTTPFKITAYSEFFDWTGEEDEEGDGEDLADDDEEELDEDEDEELLRDFLDEEEGEERSKLRKPGLGPLIPIITWNDGKSLTDCDVYVEFLKQGITNDQIDGTFDYWKTTTTTLPIDLTEITPLKPGPLPTSTYSTPLQTPSLILPISSPTPSDQSRSNKKAKTLITKISDLQIFKKKVHGTSFTIPTMVELLKVDLSGYTKATIEYTLKTYAVRDVGSKKWVVDETKFVM